MQTPSSNPQTNAQAEPVRLDKKTEIILSDGRFATIHKVKLGHALASQDENQIHQAAKLIHLTVKIDDKHPTILEILNLDLEDFHLIMHHLSLK